MEQPTVYVLTCAYNAERTIRRAIESVLNQTYQEIVYVIRDNGSTDGTYALCQEYARRDFRIRLVQNRKNCVYESEEDRAALAADAGIRYGAALGEEDFACILDADDEYLPDFFERAVGLARAERLDIAVGGTTMIQEETGRQIGEYTHAKTFLLEGKGFSEFFPAYHWHTRQVWGKLYRRHTLLGYVEYYREFLKKTLGSSDEQLSYGGDTIYALSAFQRADRVGILSGRAHRYYIQKKSVSSSFFPNRVDSDAILHNATTGFLLAKCGCISPHNQRFLQEVYSNAVADTANVIRNAALSPPDKLREYAKIASHPITLAVYRERGDESVSRSKTGLLLKGLEAGSALGRQDDSDLRTMMQTLLPRCGQAVNKENARAFLEDTALLEPLLRDDADTLREVLLGRIEGGRKVEARDAVGMLRALAVEEPLLCRIDDMAFLRRYAGVYRKVWKGERLAALDEMTGLLLENQVDGGREVFLTLFVSLAALENQAPAFIFGKMQLAELYLRQGRREQCRVVVADLTEMGVESEELEALRRDLREW